MYDIYSVKQIFTASWACFKLKHSKGLKTYATSRQKKSLHLKTDEECVKKVRLKFDSKVKLGASVKKRDGDSLNTDH